MFLVVPNTRVGNSECVRQIRNNFDHTKSRTWNHLIRSQAFYPLNYAASVLTL